MKAYKIQVDPYDYEIVTSKEDASKKEGRTLQMKFELPIILCNPSLGSDNPSKPAKDFNLMEIGPVSQRIRQCTDVFLNVNENELEILKKRIGAISKFYGYNYYEMFRRIQEAQPVDMVEAPEKGKGA